MLEFAEQVGTHKFTVINWEVRGKLPRLKSHVRTLMERIPVTRKWLEEAKKHYKN